VVHETPNSLPSGNVSASPHYNAVDPNCQSVQIHPSSCTVDCPESDGEEGKEFIMESGGFYEDFVDCCPADEAVACDIVLVANGKMDVDEVTNY
jgi:hypothetical protein